MPTMTTDYRPDVIATAVRQIGGGNLAAISGGRVTKVNDFEFDLPVAHGYSVRVYYLADVDLYVVERQFHRGINVWVKATWSNVHAEDLGEVTYRASCYHDTPKGADQ